MTSGPTKPSIMLVVPWLEVGGADAIGYQLIAALGDEFHFGLVTTLPGEHPLEDQLAHRCQWIEHAARQTAQSTNAFLKSVAERRNVQGVLVNWCAAGYEGLPQIKSLGDIWTAGIIHNTVPEAWLRHAILFDPFIDRHFAVGPAQADALIKGASINPNKVILAANGVDAAERFNPETYANQLADLRREFDIADDETVIAFIGRLSPEKDCPLFVQSVGEIISRNPNQKFRAVIAGDGPDRPQVEQEISRLRLEQHCLLIGLTDRVPELLAVSDYLFLTSKIEGSPLVLLEAMAMEVIPIATNVGTVPQVVTSGMITRNRSPEAFADAFDQVAPERSKLSTGARRTVLERFSQDQMIEAYAKVFRRDLN